MYLALRREAVGVGGVVQVTADAEDTGLEAPGVDAEEDTDQIIALPRFVLGRQRMYAM